MLGEVELVVSLPVYELLIKFQNANAVVVHRLFSETERRVAPLPNTPTSSWK